MKPRPARRNRERKLLSLYWFLPNKIIMWALFSEGERNFWLEVARW